MGDDQNTVKIKVKIQRNYHHGALRAELIAAAESVISERGVEGFSLREAARRAGVSPSAPAHHFGDTRGLLTAIATTGFKELSNALEQADAAAGPDTSARMAAQGYAYVHYAVTNTARYDLMWRVALLDRDNAEYCEHSKRAFAILDRAVRGASASGVPKPHNMAAAPSIACWSLVHGFARLTIDGMFGTDDNAINAAMVHLLPAVMACLKA